MMLLAFKTASMFNEEKKIDARISLDSTHINCVQWSLLPYSAWNEWIICKRIFPECELQKNQICFLMEMQHNFDAIFVFNEIFFSNSSSQKICWKWITNWQSAMKMKIKIESYKFIACLRGRDGGGSGGGADNDADCVGGFVIECVKLSA